MKRILAVFLILVLFAPSMACAEDFMNVTDEEIEKELASVTTEQLEGMFGEFPDNVLVALIDVINMELERRGYEATESTNNVKVPIGSYIIGEDIPAGSYTIVCDPDKLFGPMIVIYDKNGEIDSSYSIGQGDSIGKLVLTKGQSIEVRMAPAVFTPYKGLGF